MDAADSLASTRDAYDLVAGSYARLLSDTSYEDPVDLGLVRALVRAVVDIGGGPVLDAGCGSGRMMTYLDSVAEPAAESELELVGIDLSGSMVELARLAHPDRSFAVADLAELPFADRSFDGVLAWYSIIHTPPERPPAIASEVHRVLRPGGSALFAFEAGSGARVIDRPYGQDVRFIAHLHELADVGGTLRDTGLTPTTLRTRPPRKNETHDQGFVLATRPTT